ncbi:DNA/RNA nuclease SfsA [Alicyclobacillus kakegawensis]|uniref:DNA/RNA nuclease SfsA n=1 Tax=Alicyclobacillus kakegawensis TaxID=392012 RepID=UPI0008368AFD|nr:DNA/RNA nuclease SfsA [Alicyclobacillus kakegawensis]
MIYGSVVYGEWVERMNRFLARVRVDGQVERVHVKNTGRLRELFVPGRTVALEAADRSGRRTRYSVIAVRAGKQWVNVDSQAPNRVVSEALMAGQLAEFGTASGVTREVRYGQSRFDISYESPRARGFIEVKGVTLVADGVAKFPDAPTDRGTRHIYELVDAVRNGYEGTVFFLIQRQDARAFAPNREMDAKFAEALEFAARHGVRVLAYGCRVEADRLQLGDPVPVQLT